MALTAGFKKFIGLVAVIAIVGGGIYTYKQMPKATPAAEQTAPQEVATTPPPVDTSGQDVARDEPAPAPTPTPKKPTTSADRGLDAVLKAGK
jgi:hypothetical protein